MNQGPPERPRDPGSVRLNKRMAELGLCSRREADEWIAHGWVRVDGRVAVMGQPVRPDARIEVAPEARRTQAERVTILLHKPVGFVSGQPEDGYQAAVSLIQERSRWAEGQSGRGRVEPARLLPGHLRGLAPAGRLDIDSTGLLVLTQDGRVARVLIGDDSDVEKEYLVRVALPGAPLDDARADPRADVRAAVPPEAIARLRHGLSLDGVVLRPAKVSWQNESQLRFVLREGRKRQIRRMCELVGLQVVGLKRVRIGRVALGALPLGQWRFLQAHERF